MTKDPTVASALRALSTRLARLRGDGYMAAVASELAALARADVAFVSELDASATSVRMHVVGSCIDGRRGEPFSFSLAGTPCADTVRLCTVVQRSGDQVRFDDAPVLGTLGLAHYSGIALEDSAGTVLGTLAVLSIEPPVDAAGIEDLLHLFAVRTGAELERRRVEMELEDLFEHLPDATLVVDEHGRIVRANRVAESTFGYTRAELIGAPVETLVPDELRAIHSAARASSSETAPRRMGTRSGPLSARRKDASTFAADIALGPLGHRSGRRMVATVRDVSSRVRDERARDALVAKLRESEKWQAIGTLAGGIAHDFNNLLGVVVGNVGIGAALVDPTHPAADCFHEIGAVAARAADLVGQLLDFSRPRVFSPSLTPVDRIIDDVVKLLRTSAPPSITVRTRYPDILPRVWVDADQIHRVLVNIGRNAWQAMEGRAGIIELGVDAPSPCEDPTSPERDAAVGRGLVRITVRDDGPGMDATTRERAFEPFFTSKAPGRGTGLGLAIAHAIVTEHGGRIEIESTLGVGTLVSLLLPGHGAATPALPHASEATSTERRHVVCIHGDPQLLDATVRLARHLGYATIGFSSAAAAVHALSTASVVPTSVLLDAGTAGLAVSEVTRQITALRSGLPIIVMTDALTAPGLGDLPSVIAVIERPFGALELSTALARAIGEPVG